jgi:hypothetical protein
MRYLALFFVTLLMACTTPTQEEQLKNLPGYWEIDLVEFPDGTVKEFNISTTIDYITIEDSMGIRKKLAPTLKGTYYTTKSQETFTFNTTNEGLVLNYKTPFDSWSERVIRAQDSILVLQNAAGNLYKYKRFNRQINIDNL